ncbi:aspartate dehydrogenase [Polymorphum gilvum]|uniref:L-aspartate dehydrogenase n=1 Tax=Polymorphum gilvum (strain LMG 25793 / CGMCC 1.9160 / SL003B-26A1) TaxID=991905 RepID=F2IW15_POLGS|nr:aspartate dehydrogenase [Polymorphum gilvum]ADZ70297.1 Probable L-aspartate dehydrogenase [Polymorphum gilvum SL003B-26A1]
MSGSELRLVLIGWGAIATRVADLLAERAAPVDLIAVAVRDGTTRPEDLPAGTRLIDDPGALADLAFDLAVEAAGRESVGPWGRAVLARGADFAPASTSAFVDEGLLDDLTALARSSGAQLVIPPGALGGIDALAAAARLPLAGVRHEIVKPPQAWTGTPAEALCDLAGLNAPATFFEGSAREAARAFPQNANVAVITALAGLGLDRTTVALVADPGARRNSHRIRAEGDFGTMEIALENRPLASNPKSSEMTALSLVRLIENRAGARVV